MKSNTSFEQFYFQIHYNENNINTKSSFLLIMLGDTRIVYLRENHLANSITNIKLVEKIKCQMKL